MLSPRSGRADTGLLNRTERTDRSDQIIGSLNCSVGKHLRSDQPLQLERCMSEHKDNLDVETRPERVVRGCLSVHI